MFQEVPHKSFNTLWLSTYFFPTNSYWRKDSSFSELVQCSPCEKHKRHWSSLAVFPDIQYSTASSCSREMRHPFLGHQLDEPDTCFSLSMPSYNNTIMLFIPAARPETPAPSWPGAPGRRFAAPPIWPAWTRQRVFDRRWADGGWLESPPLLSHTPPPLLMQMRWWGQTEKNNIRVKTDTKEGWEGRRPTKAAQNCGSFQIAAAVSVNQASRFNNVRPLQAGLMSFLAFPNPRRQHLLDSPASMSP